MTDIASDGGKPSLGAGGLISDAFSVVLKNLGTMAVLVVAPIVIGLVLSVSLIGLQSLNPMQALVDPEAYMESTAGTATLSMLVGFINIVIWSFAFVALVKAAFDAYHGRKPHILGSLALGVKRFLPLFVVSVAAMIVIYIAAIVPVLPGMLAGESIILIVIGAICSFVVALWLLSVWAVITPTVVLEARWFGAFGRSAALTKDYRWPIVGMMVVFFIVMLLISVISIGLNVGGAALGTVGLIVTLLVNSVLTGFIYAVFASLFAVLYVRLCDIKEGGSPDALAEVFA